MAETGNAGDDRPGADAAAIDSALAAFEDACAQLIAAADGAVDHSRGTRHLAAVRGRLAADSVPITLGTADELLIAAADARAALLRVLGVGEGRSDDEDPEPEPDDAVDRLAVTDDQDDEETAVDEAEEPAGDEDQSAVSDPMLDLAPDADLDDEPVEPPPPPTGYRASAALPTRHLPHVLVFEGGRWQRASIAFAPDDTLLVRLATARRGSGRRLDEYTPAHIARPQARG